MAVTINAKGTSVSSFVVGKDGTLITQSGTISPPAASNLTINLDVDKQLVVDAAGSGPALITTSNNQDLHINPAIGGGQYLVLVANRWPIADGTNGQVLTTNGSGILSFQSLTGSGTVTDVSVVNANGFNGSVATSTETPAITISTTITGILKGNGTEISAATAIDLAPDYEEFSATSSQTIFNTTLNTVSKALGKSYLQVFVNGVFLQEGISKSYTVTGENQITFNTGLAAGDDVVIYSFA